MSLLFVSFTTLLFYYNDYEIAFSILKYRIVVEKNYSEQRIKNNKGNSLYKLKKKKFSSKAFMPSIDHSITNSNKNDGEY